MNDLGKKSAWTGVVDHSMRSSLALLVVLAAGCEKKEANEGKPPPAPVTRAANTADAAIKSEKVEVPEVQIRAEGPTTVRVTWLTPSGTAVNDEAPFRVQWNRSDGLSEAPADVKSNGSQVKTGFRVQVRPMAGAPNATLGGEINIVVCDEITHSVCVPVRRTVELGFVTTKDARPEATVSIPLPAAK